MPKVACLSSYKPSSVHPTANLLRVMNVTTEKKTRVNCNKLSVCQLNCKIEHSQLGIKIRIEPISGKLTANLYESENIMRLN